MSQFIAFALQLKCWKIWYKKGPHLRRSVDDGEESNAVKRFCKKKWIIHCTDDSDLVNPKDEESWKTLLRAAQIRNHQEIVQLSKSLRDGEVSLIYYHRKCQSIFTMKSVLDKLSQQSSNSQTHQEQVASGKWIFQYFQNIQAHLYFLWKAKIFQGYKESWAFRTMPRYACR